MARSLSEADEVCIARNTMLLAISILLPLSVLLPSSISAEPRSTANILSWIFYCLTSPKAMRRSIRANWRANRGLQLSSGYPVKDRFPDLKSSKRFAIMHQVLFTWSRCRRTG
jgi:hypothetical protein